MDFESSFFWNKKYTKFQKIIDFTLKRHVYPPLNAVSIEINSACNRKCRFCPNYNHTRKAAFLEETLFYKIINQLKELRFKGQLSFNLYNEPLLDKRLPQFIEVVRKIFPSVFIYLNTNGDLLDFPLWKKFRRAGLDYVNITQYDGKINDNIKNILNKLDPEEKKHFNAFVFNEDYACNRAGLVKLKGAVKLPVNKYCARPFNQLCVDYRGKVVLCCNDYLGLVEIGDLNREQIIDVWKSDTFVHYRKNLFLGKRAGLKLCDTCDMLI